MLARPVPGRWSTQECVGHLADTEVFFTDRIVPTVPFIAEKRAALGAGKP